MQGQMPQMESNCRIDESDDSHSLAYMMLVSILSIYQEEKPMANESLLKTLQEAMRKLTESGIACAAKITQLRERAAQAQLEIDTITVQDLAAVHEHARSVKEAKALREHVDDLVRGHADSTLIATLEDELKDLENRQGQTSQQVEALRARSLALAEPLKAIKGELTAAEEAHRRLLDRTMSLREHLEKVAHG
jgi:chromosome segregation ATPase